MNAEISPGHWIKSRRKALDLTQAGLATRASCSIETVRKIEAGALKPSRQLAEVLAEALQVPPDERPAFVRFARTEAGLSPMPTSAPPGIQAGLSPTNLYRPPTSFIGREREVARVRELLARDDVRLLTLTGPPGIGKTRLSIEAASGMGGFEDGLFFVPLAPVGDSELVVPTIARILEVREQRGQGLLAALAAYLRDRHMLLVLDNFEQVTQAGPVLAELLLAAPRLKILVSSRAVLRIYGEHSLLVPPMSLPAEGEAPRARRMVEYEAVRLFVTRAQAARPDFELTEENAPQVAGICARLDGLPLAIELAASRVRTLSPAGLLSRLGSKLDLLSAGMRDLPPRQQTLRGAVDWSYDLLGEEERALLRRVSVFVGGCTLEAAEECAGVGEPVLPRDDVLSLIESLLDKSLLRRDESGGEPRFWMLEIIRDYGLEKLEESGEAVALRQMQASYFLAMVEQAEPELQGQGQAGWLARLESEHENLRAVIRRSLDAGDIDTAARLGGGLRRFWYLRGHLTEGRRWLEEILAHGSSLSPDLRAGTLHAVGTLAWSQGDYPSARHFFEESLQIRRELGDTHGIADLLNNLGVVALPQGDVDAARAMHEESLALFRELGDRWGASMALANLGLVALHRQDCDAAGALLTESLQIRRSLGDKQSIAQSLNNLGTVMRCKGQYDLAYELHGESLEIFVELEDRWSIALCHANMGFARLSQGRYIEARGLLREGLSLFRELDVRQGVATCIEGLAAVEGRLDHPDRSARLYGAAAALREEIGVPLPPTERPDYERHLSAARASSDPARFSAAWSRGRVMSLESAIAQALSEG